jgi:hypothetical protein
MFKRLVISLVFLVMAALVRFWIAPITERLPSNYTNTTVLTEEDKFRDSTSGDWLASTLITQRVDQIITSSSRTAIIEGSLHIYFESGRVNFEATSLYGVDRYTRLNLAGFGEVNRTGQYLFPTHVQVGGYPIWDPYFIGLRNANYDHTEYINGLKVYVFTFSGTGMDETAGYSTLPDVPEHYYAHTDGQGTIWVEPFSGIVVDYMDSGVSYFVDPSTSARVADFNKWNERYTSETQKAQIKLARHARLSILALEAWLPGGFLLVGLFIPGLSLIRRKKKDARVDLS